ncbi:MAG: hypothetical protein IIB11_02440 [Chloroflexi bacterium]|nr:hypothetical protein [Chloroflexota bacterium]
MREMRRTREVMILWAVALGLLAAACGGDGGGAGASGDQAVPTMSVRGVVIQVNESLGDEGVESIVVKVGDEEATFLLGEAVDQRWDFAHLRGHKLLGTAIGIKFIREDGTLIAVDLTE